MCYVDGVADVSVSSLPERVSVEIENAVADVENNYITFKVPDEAVLKSTVFGAAYDASGRMLEIKSVNEPKGEQRLEFEKLGDAAFCNLLYVMQDSFMPLCENAYIEIVK